MGKKYKDIEIGDKYNRWTVIDKGKYEKIVDKNGKSRPKQYWFCECSCEKHTVREVNGEALKNGGSKSCGCISKEQGVETSIRLSTDISGKRYGLLTAILFQGFTNTERKRPLWSFHCDCGNDVVLRKEDVTSGHTKSCGCLKYNDITGQKFGKLFVVKKDEFWTKQYRTSAYECLCDCGNIKYIRHSSLVDNVVKSCGCLSKEIEDLVGQKFGELTVTKFLEKKYYDNASVNIWECKCSCGSIIPIAQNNLKSGNTQSCGCSAKSHGERKVSDILNKWKYEYEEQYRFEDCKFKYTLPFDFCIKNDNKIMCLVEYDGKQHYMPVQYPNMTMEQSLMAFEETKIRDSIKTNYCLNNHIPLIRIPYWEFDDLEYFLFNKLVKYKVIHKLHKAS